MVLVEGGIAPKSPVAVKGDGGMEQVYSSPMELTTPAVVILDKDGGQYHVRVTYQGYPEFEKTLATRFAFHPFLIITFPVVPLFSDYEIQRFDDVFVDFEAFKAELEAAKYGEAESYLDRIVVKDSGRIYFVNTSDIIRIKADGKYLKIRDPHDEHTIRKTLTQLEGQLDPKRFIRIHRSVILNVNHIREMQHWYKNEYIFILSNGEKFTSGSSYRQNLDSLLKST